MQHIVIDFEMNAMRGIELAEGVVLNQEIIEIGAVRLNDELEQIDTYSCYIKPINNTLTNKCKKLTGISEEDLESAVDLEVAMRGFMAWIGDKEFTIYAWSENDLKQLTNECIYKNIKFEGFAQMLTQWIDLQEIFGQKLGVSRRIGLKDALGALELNFSGKQHQALDDAVNTSYILRMMNNEGELERKLRPIREIFEEPEDLVCSIGSLIGDQLRAILN